MMTKEQVTLFSLIRTVAGGHEETLMQCDSSRLFALCMEHGVASIVMAGMQWHSDNKGIRVLEKDHVLKLYAAVQRQRLLMEQKKRESVEFIRRIGLPCVVLKGLDYCRFWPQEDWRPFGDLDIWLGKGYEQGNEMARRMGCKMVADGYYKHSEFLYKSLMVENHQFFTMCDDTKGGKALETALRQLAHSCNVHGANAWLSPCNEFTALFMLVHAHQHFFFEGMQLKQILDWHFFLQKEEGNVDWPTVIPVMEQAGIRGFFDVMTAFCVRHLGLETSLDYCADDDVVERFTDEVFADVPSDGKLGHLLRRFRRMWRFRAFLGESILVRIKNTLVYNRLHKKPDLS